MIVVVVQQITDFNLLNFGHRSVIVIGPVPRLYRRLLYQGYPSTSRKLLCKRKPLHHIWQVPVLPHNCQREQIHSLSSLWIRSIVWCRRPSSCSIFSFRFFLSSASCCLSIGVVSFFRKIALNFSSVEWEEEEEIYLPRTITILNQKNTILMLARSRLPEKQKAIYAGRQHC